jgi:3-hydroxyacyl-CoA dehydrogenase
MAKIEEIQNVAIVGTGVIGASWAAYYLSRGFSVERATRRLANFLDAAAPNSSQRSAMKPQR